MPAGPRNSLADAHAAPKASVSQNSSKQNPAGGLHGSIVSREGSAYEGARVDLATSTGATARRAVSDDAGQFSYGEVEAGPYTLTVSGEGFATQTLSGILRPGETVELKPIILPVSGAVSEVRVSATRHEIAQEQLHQEEHQRVLGIVPNFYVSYAADAVPLTASQKLHLSGMSLVDPMTILGSLVTAGMEQNDGDLKDFGQGTAGYSKRFAADYGDNLIGTVLGSAVLPAVFKQDPRYFYKGTGSVGARIFYALANAVVCKGDNGRWQLNYSHMLGGLAGTGIAELYYPADDRKGASLVFEDFAIGKATGAAQNILQEFVVRRFTPRRRMPPGSDR